MGNSSAEWRAVGVSVQGSGHRERGLPCQDAHVCRRLPGGELVIAVADGAGSAACAAEGAACAAVEAAASLAETLARAIPGDEAGWHDVALQGFAAARSALVRLANAAQRPLRDFATTLTCAVLAGGWLATGQLGDGLAVARSGEDLLLVARPQRGEYANEAYFLSQEDALACVASAACQGPVDALALSTDGLLRVALRLPGLAPHAPFFRPLFDYVAGAATAEGARPGLLSFLDSPRLCARTDDDKTLVLAVRSGRARALQDGSSVLALGAPDGFADQDLVD